MIMNVVLTIMSFQNDNMTTFVHDCDILQQFCDYLTDDFDPHRCCGCYNVDVHNICHIDIRGSQKTGFIFQLFFGYIGAGGWYFCNTRWAPIFVIGCIWMCCARFCDNVNSSSRVFSKCSYVVLIAIVISVAWILVLALIGNNKIFNQCNNGIECVPIPFSCE